MSPPNIANYSTTTLKSTWDGLDLSSTVSPNPAIMEPNIPSLKYLKLSAKYFY